MNRFVFVLSLVQKNLRFCKFFSGGREFVFQTGPENPWILNTYAVSAKYPFASVVAQEIFKSGVTPSDTDFRVFVQYGNYVGKIWVVLIFGVFNFFGLTIRVS